jgi:hypothetical protein
MATTTESSTDIEKRRDFSVPFKKVQVELRGGTVKLECLFAGTDETDDANWLEIEDFTRDGAFVLQEMRGSYRLIITGNARIDI